MCWTTVDPSRAPAGKHTLYIYHFEPYHLRGRGKVGCDQAGSGRWLSADGSRPLYQYGEGEHSGTLDLYTLGLRAFPIPLGSWGFHAHWDIFASDYGEPASSGMEQFSDAREEALPLWSLAPVRMQG